jgi:hypothetical protein
MSGSDFDPSGPVQRPRTRPANTRSGPPPGVLPIVLSLVALLAGFLILRSISSESSGTFVTPGPGAIEETELDDEAADTTTTTTTTTEPPLVFDGATVVVANANSVGGSAGQMTRALEAAGFTISDAVNAAGGVGVLETSLVYYDAGAEGSLAVAESVVRVLGGGLSVAPLPEVAPTTDGTVSGQVLVMLGNDKAGKTLAELAPAPSTEVVAPPEPAAVTDADPDADPDG